MRISTVKEESFVERINKTYVDPSYIKRDAVDQISGVPCPDCGVKVPLRKVNRHPVTLVTQVITRAYKKALAYFENEILKSKTSRITDKEVRKLFVHVSPSI